MTNNWNSWVLGIMSVGLALVDSPDKLVIPIKEDTQFICVVILLCCAIVCDTINKVAQNRDNL